MDICLYQHVHVVHAGIMLRKTFLVHIDTKESHANNELLYRMLPNHVMNQILKGDKNLVNEFSGVSILFSDIVRFTDLSSKIGPAVMVSMLEKMFHKFDEATKS